MYNTLFKSNYWLHNCSKSSKNLFFLKILVIGKDTIFVSVLGENAHRVRKKFDNLSCLL